MATINSFADALEEARRYLGEYRAMVIGHPEAFEGVANRAAVRWSNGRDLGHISDEDLASLYQLVDEEANEYARETARHLDGTSLAPCLARDAELGYVLKQRPSARDFASNGDYSYYLAIWPDGSATMTCTQKGEPSNEYWTYPIGPDEDLRFFEGVPWEIRDRFQRVRKWAANPKAS